MTYEECPWNKKVPKGSGHMTSFIHPDWEIDLEHNVSEQCVKKLEIKQDNTGNLIN